jgi:hypothetical protein
LFFLVLMSGIMALPAWVKNKTVWMATAAVLVLIGVIVWAQFSAKQDQQTQKNVSQDQENTIDSPIPISQIAVTDTLDATFAFSYPSDWTLLRQQTETTGAYQLTNGSDVLVFAVQRYGVPTEQTATADDARDTLVVQGVVRGFGRREGANEPNERVFLETPTSQPGITATSIPLAVGDTRYSLRVYKYNTGQSLFVRNTTAQKQQAMIDIIKTLMYK